MSTAELLNEVRKRGIVLEAQGDELRYRAPKGTLAPDLVDALKSHKAEILAVLQGQQPTAGKGLCPGPHKCAGCYSIGVIDGSERHIHPPKVSQDWLRQWQPQGKVQ
jgi:hypothetical protein